MSEDVALRRARKWLAAFASLAIALLMVATLLAARLVNVDRTLDTQRALDDPRVREAVIARLLEGNRGIFDSHPDPAIGRILQAIAIDIEEDKITNQPLAGGVSNRRVAEILIEIVRTNRHGVEVITGSTSLTVINCIVGRAALG